LKERITRYILIALIIGFFAIPLTLVCFFDCKFYAPKKIASILLFFFR
jgi:hypothetical protein